MEPIKTEAFDLALKFINETNVNIFLTGKAGTGKTTFLKYLKENPIKNMAIAAPTGVAAINAGGITLHSMFHLPFGPFIPVHSGATFGFDKKTLLSRLRYNSDKINFINALELLVIDEASMVAAYTVDAIDTILRSVRHKQIPFGGVQVLFIGDLYQLQPVVKDNERLALKPHYSSNFFFDSHVLRDNIPIMVELKTIFRQKDEKFIDILNGLRENMLTKEHLAILNSRLNRDFISRDGDGYITLTTHNVNANRLNELKLNRLKTPQLKFQAEIGGIFPEHILPAEKELILKRDAQVMFIKNDSEGKKFFNGKIGVITDISKDEILSPAMELIFLLGNMSGKI
ncbi:MAG: AAA family ATPase [Bacteroidetes bacterium]|nr:AAA family ATPase [Bacteroidota bacterium]